MTSIKYVSKNGATSVKSFLSLGAAILFIRVFGGEIL
jgi:hypothetical protein